eukprot:CAMPEP_0178787122 /NCGR_PEP_ID=MMETSP0745-20121128/5685_1 /TAXON_ID=913974 /ORGANISM="Nitzschia punctata, Strain CCMP561" /LENGTH=267 /DNA_ID=CAMNT_0020444949 /DNA_START=1660 /DNA_END=2463 /DNA_ORIENTATION=-
MASAFSSTKVPRLDDNSSTLTTDHTVVNLNVSSSSSLTLNGSSTNWNDSHSLTLDGSLTNCLNISNLSSSTLRTDHTVVDLNVSNVSSSSSLTLDGIVTTEDEEEFDIAQLDRLSIQIVWKKKDYEYLLPSLLPFPQAIFLQPQYQQLYHILYQLIKQRYSVIQEEQCDDSFDHFTTDLTKKEGVYWGHASWGDKIGSSRHVKKRVNDQHFQWAIQVLGPANLQQFVSMELVKQICDLKLPGLDFHHDDHHDELTVLIRTQVAAELL